MQLHQLQYFVAVARTRHFTRAAQELRIAQPSLSQQIKALERSLGTELIERTRGNIGLTPAGEALLPIAQRIVADVEMARQEVHELVELRRGRVRLGAPPSLLTGLLPDVAREFRVRYPGIHLMIEESGSQNLVAKAATGELDLALVVLPLRRADPTLQTAPLLREELVVVSSTQEPAPTRDGRPIAVSELEGRPLVMFRPGYDLREVTMDACRAEGFEPTLVVEGGEMDAVLSMVAAGLGWAVLPSTVAEGRASHRVTQFAAPGLARTIGVAHRRDVPLPGAARELQTVLLEYLAEQDRSGRLPAGTRLMVGLSGSAVGV
ncbi:LysR family transcriptional regulator [Spongisporangium articulatum]|uniref:LysR family transcriptional regulator n=1 Tax=Spongisporangium articulatum TaxID=3362603 RepID=A0ABW8ASM1_9ACTN